MADDLTRSSIPVDPANAPTLPPDDEVGTRTSPSAPRGYFEPPPHIPGYDLTEPLGEGGMGVVWKARQVGLNRVVALKMVHGGRGGIQKELIRFLAEAEAVASVRHPQVVQVYEFGEAGGRPFLAMEYLGGGSLQDRLKKGRLTPRESAELIAIVARGVQAAHEAGIVHRDIKPANVLFNESGEPKVTDFGLAKRGGGTDLTKTQAVMGTPAYMAPEQARGQTKFVGPQADVYALGVTLFECLTGRVPFQAEETLALILKVSDEAPPKPRSLVPDVPRDLELVCLKCLAKDPVERYPTAKELADDLDRFRAGESVTVRAAGVVERTAKWARRNPTRAAAYGLTGLAAVLIPLTAGVGWLWQRAEHDRHDAVISRDSNLKLLGELNVEHNKSINALSRETLALREAEAARDREMKANTSLQSLGYARNVDLAHREYQADNLGRAQTLLDACPPERRNWEWHYVNRLCNAYLFALHRGKMSVTTAAYSPDGTRIATGGYDNTARIWDAATGQQLLRIDTGAAVVRLTFSPDGKRLATSLNSGQVAVWDAVKGVLLARTLKQNRNLDALTFSPDGNLIAGIEGYDKIKVYDTTTSKERASLEFKANTFTGMVFADDSSRLYYLGPLMRDVRFWDAATGAVKPLIKADANGFFCFALSGDGKRIATGNAMAIGRIWDVATATELAVLTGHKTLITSIQFTAGDRRVVTASMDGSARVWVATSGSERAVIQISGATFGFTQLIAVASSDGERIATFMTGRPPVIWTAAGKKVATLKGPPSPSVEFSPDGTRILTWNHGNDARVWATVKAPDRINRPVEPGDYDPPIASPEGKIFPDITTDPTGRVRVRDPDTGKTRQTLLGHAKPVKAWAISRDGGRLATGDETGLIHIWDLATGRDLKTIEEKKLGSVRELTFDPDGRRLVVVRWGNGPAEVRDSATGKLLNSLNAPGGAMMCRFSPDGSRIVVVANDSTAAVWDLAGPTQLAVIVGQHRATITAVTMSHDNTRVATIHSDRAIKVWDARDGHDTLTLAVPGVQGLPDQLGLFPLRSVRFSADGVKLIVAHPDQTALVFDSSPITQATVAKESAPPPQLRP